MAKKTTITKTTVVPKTNPKGGTVQTKTIKDTAKLSGRQQIKMAKVENAGKLNRTQAIAKEAGATLRSIAGSLTGQKVTSTIAEAEVQKELARVDAATKSVNEYNNLINGVPEATGESGSESTSGVGGSGSALGG